MTTLALDQKAGLLTQVSLITQLRTPA
jgi:hypothetical protein